MAALKLTSFFLFPGVGRTWSVQGLLLLLASQLVAIGAQVSFVISELPLPKPK